MPTSGQLRQALRDQLTTLNVGDVEITSDPEGWCISNGSDDLPEVQRDQDLEIFATDQEAWKFVVLRAIEGSDFHKRTLRKIKEKPPTALRSV